MNRIETMVIVGQPSRIAFSYLSRLENMREWSGAREVRRDAPGRVRTGTQYEVDGKIGPKKVTTHITITDYQPGKQFGARSELGPFSFYDRYVFDAVPGGTQITQFTRVRSRGVFRLLVPMVTRLMRGRIQAGLYRACELMEENSK